MSSTTKNNIFMYWHWWHNQKNADIIIFWQTNDHKIKSIAQILIVPSFNCYGQQERFYKDFSIVGQKAPPAFK